MKTILMRVVVLIIVLVGIWYVWPTGSSAPEAIPSASVRPSPSASPTIIPTKTPVKTPARTPTPTPAGTPIPDVAPTITSVTAYEVSPGTTAEPAGWWVRIVGTLPNSCAQLNGASFSRDGNAFMVSLPAMNVGDVCAQTLRTFTQTIRLSDLSLTPGIYSVFVNARSWTSFIID